MPEARGHDYELRYRGEVAQLDQIRRVDPQDISFIEASDNYCTFYWYDSGILKNKILRQTLKNVEEQLLPFNNIVRCHKTFMVNLHQELTITGNARAHFLESGSLPIRIPISRSKSKSIAILLDKD